MKLEGANNWNIWKFQTTVMLRGQGWLDIVEGRALKPEDPTERTAWENKDAKAQTLLVTRMTENVMLHIVTCTTSAPPSWPSYVFQVVPMSAIFHFVCEKSIPRKDKCAKCVRLEKDNGQREEEKLAHLKDKEETYERFQAHQKIQDENILCVSFDLQKVLNTPYWPKYVIILQSKIGCI